VGAIHHQSQFLPVLADEEHEQEHIPQNDPECGPHAIFLIRCRRVTANGACSIRFRVRCHRHENGGTMAWVHDPTMTLENGRLIGKFRERAQRCAKSIQD
jgi:hypothetical protein